MNHLALPLNVSWYASQFLRINNLCTEYAKIRKLDKF